MTDRPTEGLAAELRRLADATVELDLITRDTDADVRRLTEKVESIEKKLDQFFKLLDTYLSVPERPDP